MKTVSFTGHRPKDLFGYTYKSKYLPLVQEIERILLKLKSEYSDLTVITGGAQGVDMIAGSVASRIDGITTKAYLPCQSQESKWSANGMFGQIAYNNILYKTGEIKYISDAPYSGPKDMVRRNHAMVDNSDIVIAIYSHNLSNASTHRKSGTAETIRYALRKGKTIIHHNPMTGVTSIRKGGDVN